MQTILSFGLQHPLKKMEPTQIGVKDKNTLKLVCSGRHCFWYRGKEWQIANSSTLRPNNNVLTIEDVNYYKCFDNLQIENSWGKQYQLNVTLLVKPHTVVSLLIYLRK